MSTRQPLIPPINLIFNYLEKQSTIKVWLYENTHSRIQGKISGFDEFMNLVIDNAIEIPIDNVTGVEQIENGKKLGQILLKGDNITLITSVD
ncbi:hypothetical protein TBLA_0A06790 [Henningerozyma blattae CBS 6284]|uniref:Small nuclear ribonucleoprotein E n=1 Tax=Henningerozyma blattae (strain ATCC 34711 / CBS 6284 / DSM 70876 / NBRC 10599 / NRRL Y-10934 / UCD 77-7) TaxID=1071380 RepID=I2GWG9_HENB6|nr:hypothetical protein TBLA_0A06790 [Tetrapisispora blattae CBS 6284]CCH58471.1 hypothetical protein TBLA_0A06790 [Tetrapisispora blattae CBS 6284]